MTSSTTNPYTFYNSEASEMFEDWWSKLTPAKQLVFKYEKLMRGNSFKEPLTNESLYVIHRAQDYDKSPRPTNLQQRIDIIKASIMEMDMDSLFDLKQVETKFNLDRALLSHEFFIALNEVVNENKSFRREFSAKLSTIIGENKLSCALIAPWKDNPDTPLRTIFEYFNMVLSKYGKLGEYMLNEEDKMLLLLFNKFKKFQNYTISDAMKMNVRKEFYASFTKEKLWHILESNDWSYKPE